MSHEPRFQSLDSSHFDDGTIPLFNADTGTFQPVGGVDGTTLRVAQILTDDGAPLEAHGFEGDFYLDQLSGDFYRKISDTWVHKGSLKGAPGGPDGDQGPAGDKGPVGDQGPTGDKGLVGDKGAQGDKGPTGDKGTQGDPGLSGIPSNDANIVHKSDYLVSWSKANNFNAYKTEVDNFYAMAHKRYLVTATGFANNGGVAALFDGSYQQGLVGEPNTTGVLTIDLLGRNEYAQSGNVGFVYADGYLLLTFYYGQQPQSVNVRIQDYKGVWYNMPPAEQVGTDAVNCFRVPTTNPGVFRNYAIKIEISVTARPDKEFWFNGVEGVLLNPTQEQPNIVNRTTPQVIYQPWEFRNYRNERTILIDPGRSNVITAGDYVSPYNSILNGYKAVYQSDQNDYFWQALNRFSVSYTNGSGANIGSLTYTNPFGSETPGGAGVTEDTVVMYIDLAAKGEIPPVYYDMILFMTFYYQYGPATANDIAVRIKKNDGTYSTMPTGSFLVRFGDGGSSASLYRQVILNVGGIIEGIEITYKKDPAQPYVWLSKLESYLTSFKGQQTSGIRRDHPLDSFFPIRTRNAANSVTAEMDTEGNYTGARGTFHGGIRVDSGQKVIFESVGESNVLYRDTDTGDTIVGSASQNVKFTNGDKSTLGDINIRDLRTSSTQTASGTPDTIVGKFPLYDANGTLIGYLPIYNSIP